VDVRRTSVSINEPTKTENLDGYGNPPLEWSRARDELIGGSGEHNPFFLSTIKADGTPHITGTGAIVVDHEIYLVSGPGTQKSRNLARNPACAMAISLKTVDVTLEGTAARVTDKATLEKVAATYREVSWPVEVEGDAFTAPYSAPSAGPPPWYLYRVAVHTVYAVGTAQPDGATRWTFTS
jgi:nitroimidazol reductase NimA-like FMN-containing flavoprotein (pyridoxamine 5'-phosphate oxidase superfamily)